MRTQVRNSKRKQSSQCDEIRQPKSRTDDIPVPREFRGLLPESCLNRPAEQAISAREPGTAREQHQQARPRARTARTRLLPKSTV